MRITAGILMMIGALLGITMLRAVYGFIPGLLGWLPWMWAGLVGVGGIYTLKRKVWGMCLIAGILTIPIGIIPFLAWGDVLADISGEASDIAFVIVMTLFFLAIAILPVVGVRLKKREWES